MTYFDLRLKSYQPCKFAATCNILIVICYLLGLHGFTNVTIVKTYYLLIPIMLVIQLFEETFRTGE